MAWVQRYSSTSQAEMRAMSVPQFKTHIAEIEKILKLESGDK